MIEGVIEIVGGTSRKLPRTLDVTDILPDTLAEAYFTVKRDPTDTDAAALIQKHITTSLDDTSGQIEEAGATDRPASFFFLLSASETSGFSALETLWYDVKVVSSGGAADVPERGYIRFLAQITKAASDS